MIDFLRKCGFRNSVINEIKSNNSDANVYNLSCNQYEVLRIVEFLKSLGVKNIGVLLSYKINLFFMTLEEVMRLFDREDVNLVVDRINTNYMYIDTLL